MKIEIFSGKSFSADFTVVSDDGVTGEELSDTDTASITIMSNGTNSECIHEGLPLTIVDKSNGVFNLTMTAAQTNLLHQDVGFKEDRYPTLSNYSGYLDFNLASGNRQAMVSIFVRDARCQA